MSNKHYRRKEAALILEKTLLNEKESLDEEVIERPKVNKFAFLEEEEIGDKRNQEDVEEENGESNINRKTTSKKMKKKKKKAEKKDENLRDLNNFNKSSLNGESSKSVSALHETILKVDSRALNPDNELRRLLGKTFSRAMDADQRGNAANNRFHRTIHSKLVKPNPGWPPLSQLGIFMSLDREKDGIKWYRFQHNENYQELQQHFWIYQSQMDYDSIMNSIMAKNPYHLDSLLLMAEYMRVQEDAQSARDAIERGLFGCESAFHSSFQLLSMDCRLSYEWRENRAFYLLLHYNLLSLFQRNCFGTALEFAKIIFMKEPSEDPIAILLLVDSIALKAKKYQFCIDFFNAFKEEKNLDMLPNFLYSTSLAYFLMADAARNGDSTFDEQNAVENAEKCFEVALSRFPFLLGQILDRLQIKPDSAVESNYALSTLAFYKESEGLRLIADIYLHHTLELWKSPKVLSWLEATTHKILPKLSSSAPNGLKSTLNEWAEKRKRCFVGMPKNILRHSILHSVRADESGANSSLVDPCPPEKTLFDYKRFDLNELRHNLGVESAVADSDLSTNTLLELVRSLLPEEYQPHLATVGENLRTYVGGILDRLVLNLNTSDQQQNNTPVELSLAGVAEDGAASSNNNSSENNPQNSIVQDENVPTSNNTSGQSLSLIDSQTEVVGGNASEDKKPEEEINQSLGNN